MEINVTRFLESVETYLLSGSVAELGDNAARETWSNSLQAAAESPPIPATDSNLDEIRDYARGFGAWSESEIAAWSDTELVAFLCQDIAAARRDLDQFETEDGEIDWTAVEVAMGKGTISGQMYPGDDGSIYFLLSH